MFPGPIATLAQGLVVEARRAGLRIATAESCTGGLIAAAITQIPGSSDVFERGFVVYTNRAKTEMLGVPAELIERFGAVSEQTARAMAEGALKSGAAQLTVSCTGIAGPTGGTPAKPVGLVHLAAARAGQTILHLQCMFGDIGRSEVRLKSVEAGLKLLLRTM